MRQLPQAYFDALDEQPQRRAGGYILVVEQVGQRQTRGGRVETRSRGTRFPRREARSRYLELVGYLMQKETT